MTGVLSTFGIDWRLLIINAVNFALLMAALWYFLYRPITDMLEERRMKVAKGVEDAQEAQRKLADIEGSRQVVLAQAGSEADQILMEARSAAEEKERDILARGEASASVLLRDASAEAQELKTRAIQESKEEVAKLIVLGMEKAMAKK